MCKVSVIIPTYNHCDYVLQALDSVFSQTFADYEVIVVNDGSPDNTAEVLRPLVESGRIKYIEQPNAGQAAARNRGLAEAKGEFIAFLDDDDLWSSDSLEWRLAELKARTEVVAVGGFAVPIDEQGRQAATQPCNGGLVDRDLLYSNNPFTSPGQVLVRREALLKVGGFDPSVWGADDLDLWFRLASLGEIRLCEQRALYYRIHSSNASRDKPKMLREMRSMLLKHLAEESPRKYKTLRREAHRFIYRYAGLPIIAAIRGDLRRGRLTAAARKSISLRPIAAAILTDPKLFYWFLTAWTPRLRSFKESSVV